MALDFPNSPTAGQLYAAPNGVTYQWSTTYTAWLPLAVTSAGTGDFFATTTALIATGGPTTVVFPTVVTGNSGGWYNTANGRYTPPAGRYLLYGLLNASSTTSAITTSIILRKNGTAILSALGSAGAANLWSMPAFSGEFDANGTDWFDIQSQNGGDRTGVTSWFGAFPISAAGPAAGTGSSWRQIARYVPSGGETQIDFQNIPVDINDLELRFDVIPATNACDISLRGFDGSGTIVTTNYFWALSAVYPQMANGSAPLGYGSTTNTYTATLIMNDPVAGGRISNSSGVNGRATLSNIRSTRNKYVHFQTEYLTDNTTAWYAVVGSGAMQIATTLTGLRLYFTTSNFAAGGAVSLWGSP